MILAHRGDSFHAPENTLEAAKLGLASGADGWELDVHLSLDGVPVVIHDESLLRTTDVARQFAGDSRSASHYLVGDFLWEEIRRLDAGSWFVDPAGGYRSASTFGTLSELTEAQKSTYRSSRVGIPRLQEALEWTRDVGWLVNIELKPSPANRSNVVESVLSIVGSLEIHDQVTISSFDHPAIALVSSLDPSVATGLLISEPLARSPNAMVAEFGADAIHASVACCCSASSPKQDFPRGLWEGSTVPLLVYTLNDVGPSTVYGRLAEAGVTGIFTDDPTSFRRPWIINPS